MRRFEAIYAVGCLLVAGCASHVAFVPLPVTKAAESSSPAPTEAALVDEPAAVCAPVDESKLEPPPCSDGIASVAVPPIVDRGSSPWRGR